MASYKVEVLSSPESDIATRAHWDIGSQRLFYVDIYNNNSSLLCYDYAENKTYSATIGLLYNHRKWWHSFLNEFFIRAYIDNEPVVAFIIPVENTTDEFAVGIGRRVGIVRWNGRTPKATLLRIALEVETNDDRFKTNRFNDAKADPRGRFFGGTMRLEEFGDIFEVTNGNLHRYDDTTKRLVTVKTNVGISNGQSWNETIGKYYYIDSVMADVKQFDYNVTTGEISMSINFRFCKLIMYKYLPPKRQRKRFDRFPIEWWASAIFARWHDHWYWRVSVRYHLGWIENFPHWS